MNLKSIPPKEIWRVFLPAGILIFGFVAFMLSCSNDSTTFPSEPRTWYYAYEFEQDSDLVARPDQVVILDIVPGEELSEHAIPYQYTEEGGYLYAIESDDPFITRVEVFDRFGVMAAATERGDGGVYLDMAPGSYSIKVYHDGAEASQEGSVAFVRRQPTDTAPSDIEAAGPWNVAEGTSLFPVYPVYGALYFKPISAHPKRYNLVAVHDVVEHQPDDLTLDVLKGVSTDTKGDALKERRHLFSFEKVDKEPGRDEGNGYGDFLGKSIFHSWVFPNKTFYSGIWDCGIDEFYCPPSQGDRPIPGNVIMPMYVDSEQNYPVSVYGYDYDDDFCFECYVHDYGKSYVYLDIEDDATYNDYLYFRKFSGEGNTYFTMDHTFRFYKDGSQISKKDRQNLKTGEVALYEGENYTGVAVVLSASFSEMTLIPLAQVKSVAFGLYTNTTVQFFENPGFTGDLIKTVGVDMPDNLNINGADIGSIKIFTDAKKILIASKKCPYCNLAGVDLSGLNLDDSDLANANLMNVNLHHSSLKKSNLSHALLNGAKLPNANLSGASLLGAALNADSNLNLAAAILTGAYLKDANCKGADLGGVDFTDASFHTWAVSYDQDGCAQDDDNPPFTKNCASAEGATLNGTIFNNAYLAGCDFTNASAIAAVFSYAVLTGAIFKGANLDWDGATGNRTNFIGAFIGGADFTNATVESADFESAYVNFSTNPNDYSIYFTIPSAHTGFPGFDVSHGDTPCVWLTYSKATVAPVTKSGNTCPDGNPGPCGDTAWTSPANPRDQSPWTNSQGQTQPAWCARVDWEW